MNNTEDVPDLVRTPHLGIVSFVRRYVCAVLLPDTNTVTRSSPCLRSINQRVLVGANMLRPLIGKLITA